MIPKCLDNIASRHTMALIMTIKRPEVTFCRQTFAEKIVEDPTQDTPKHFLAVPQQHGLIIVWFR